MLTENVTELGAAATGSKTQLRKNAFVGLELQDPSLPDVSGVP